MKSSDKTLSDWIKLNSFYELRKKDSLGTILGFLILLVGAIFLSFSAALLFMLLATITGYGPYQPDQDASALRNLGLIAVGIFGAPFIVWRSWVAHQQVNISEQNQITDRITKAVEGLGAERTVKEIIEGFSASDVGFNERFIELTKPNIEVRIGSIYSLERISKDSSRDHIQIMEILCAYIRQNSGTQGNLDERELKLRPVPRSDVQ
ncbi:MAG: pentapeptide repeat-containing protein, partial [Pseudomonadota bacterium]